MWVSQVVQWGKTPPAMQEMQGTPVQPLGQGGPLEKERPPTPVFFPGESHRWRSLVGTVHGVADLDVTEAMEQNQAKLISFLPLGKL